MKMPLPLAIAAATLCSSLAHAAAVQVTDATATGFIQLDLGTYYSTDTGLDTSRTVSFGGDVASFSTYAADPRTPVVTSSISSGDDPDNVNSAHAGIQYYYVVTGATGSVPVDIAYTLHTSAGVNGNSIAQMNVGLPISLLTTGHQEILFQHSNDGLVDQSTQTGTYVNASDAGTTYEVAVGTEAGETGSNATASAYADPYLFIDPAYLAAHPGASLVISAGIGNVAPVPEPASGALMLAGAGLLGLRRWRRRGAGAAS